MWLDNKGSIRDLTFQRLFLLIIHKLKVLEMLLFLKDYQNVLQNKLGFQHYIFFPFFQAQEFPEFSVTFVIYVVQSIHLN